MSIASAYSAIEAGLTAAWQALLEKTTDQWEEKNARNLVAALQTLPGNLVVTLPGEPSQPTMQNETEFLTQCLKLAYQLCEDRKATMPMQLNYQSLAATIASIPGVYGVLTYLENGVSKKYYITNGDEMDALNAGSAAPETDWDIELDTATIKSSQVTQFEWTGLEPNGRISYFLCGCANLTTVLGTEKMMVTGRNYCNSCPKLNCPMTYTAPSSINSFDGTMFLFNCTSFNSPVTIRAGANHIGDSFLMGCEKFNQPLTIPSTVRKIEHGFLSNCTSFNQLIELPLGLNTMDAFLSDCTSFDQPLTIPGAVTDLGSGFLHRCENFNSPLTIYAPITTIKPYFLAGCIKFNQPLTLPDTVTTIGSAFLYFTTNFSQSLTLPDSVATISEGFMGEPTNFVGPLTVPAGISYYGDEEALSSFTGTVKSYTQGITISGPGASQLKAAYPNQSDGYYRKLK